MSGVSLAAMLFATGAVAQQTPDYVGDTTGGPTFDRPQDPNECCYRAPTTAYEAVQIRVTEALSFAAQINRVTANFDTFLYLYLGEFDPANPAGFVAANDDFGFSTSVSQISSAADGPIAEGNYTLVATGWVGNDFGVYNLYLTDAVLGWGPLVSEQLDEVKAALSLSGRQVLRLSTGLVDEAVTDSFATRAQSNVPLVSRGAVPRDTGLAYVWVEGQYSYGSGNDRSSRAPLAQVGVDYAIRDDLILGVALGHADLSVDAPGLSLEGSETFVQPYLGWSSGPWDASASLSFGTIKYDEITSTSGVASAEGELIALHGRVSRRYDLGDGLSLAPFAAVSAARIKLDTTSGTLAGTGLDDSVEFQELRLGGVLTETIGQGTLSVGLSADYFDSDAPVALFSGNLDETGWSGTFEMDYARRLSGGLDLNAGISASGLGSDMTVLKASLGLGMSLLGT